MKLRIVLLLMSILSVGTVLADNRALLVGIGNYDESATGFGRIHGNNDVELIRRKLKGFSVSCLIDARATKKNILHSLDTLCDNTRKGDVVYLHFSGHGQLVQDFNSDEHEGPDQAFVCYDACRECNYRGSGYRGENHLIDDELFPYLNKLKKRVGRTGWLIVIFDSCFSGDADRGEMICEPHDNSAIEWLETTRGTDAVFAVNQSAKTYLRTIVPPGNYSKSGGHVIIISACASDSKNYESRDLLTMTDYGTLSLCISKMLDKKIPFAQWPEFFRSGSYRKLEVFPPYQVPVVKEIKPR